MTKTQSEIIKIILFRPDGLTFEEFAKLLSEYTLEDILISFDYIDGAMPKTTPCTACGARCCFCALLLCLY